MKVVSEIELEPIPAPVPKSLRKFETMRPDAVPSGVLRWRSAEEKGEVRQAWHLAVMALHAKHSRVILLAWTLMQLSAKDGYAIAGDTHLASITTLPKKNIQAGLTQMERAGLIVRVHVPNPAREGGFERRIYLAKAIIDRAGIPPATRGGDTPCDKGTEEKRRHKTPRSQKRLTTRELARLNADRRKPGERHWLAEEEPA